MAMEVCRAAQSQSSLVKWGRALRASAPGVLETGFSQALTRYNASDEVARQPHVFQ
jgi:hypothetical protein